MIRKRIKINIYYGEKFPIMCKTLYNVGVYAALDVKVLRARKLLQQQKIEQQKQEEQKQKEQKQEELKEIKEPKEEKENVEVLTETKKEKKNVEVLAETKEEKENAEVLAETKKEKENVEVLAETNNVVSDQAKQTEESNGIVIEGLQVEETSGGEIKLDYNSDESDDEIIDPRGIIEFLRCRNIEDIKVEFVSRIDPSLKTSYFTHDKCFVIVLDRFLGTHMYDYIDPADVSNTISSLDFDTVFGQSRYDDWVDFMSRKNLNIEIKSVCIFLNKHLCLRTFLCGNNFTLADIYMFYEMFIYFRITSPLSQVYMPMFPNVTRWFSLITQLTRCEYDPDVVFHMERLCMKLQNNVNAMNPSNELNVDAAGRRSKNIATSYVGKLQNAQPGKVVTRFPPEPSGFLHIGHLKAAYLNSYYAKYYEGKMLLRFDDTNPVLEDIKYENAIIEDLKELGLEYEKVSYTSQYFDLLEEYCIKLIKMGKAYADDTDVDTMRQQRGEGIESVHRNRHVKESLDIFEEMKKGTDIGQKNCIRARMNMKSKNKCMRDPVIYRCIVDVPHHKYEFKYKCYPTYDFACPIIDSIEGITHALRTNEYSDRIEQYNWVLKTLDLKHVHIYEFSRISFVRTVMSKRKLKWFVENNIVEGWDDPRMPTIRGILRRGLCKEALFQFILEQGPSKAGNLMQWDKLWAINKQLMDPFIPRYSAVSKKGVHITLKDLDATVVEMDRYLHMKNPFLGQCKLFYTNDILIDVEDAETLTPGEEITIIKLGNIIIEDIIKENENTKEEKETEKMKITAVTNFNGDYKKTKKKIHWIPFIPDKLVHCILYEYDHLITVDKLDPDVSDWKTFVNYNSKHETHVYAEPEFIHVKVKDKLQFERRGYFIVDSIVNGVYHLIKIPDGKSKNMSIISSKVDAKNLAGTKDKEKGDSGKKEN